MMLIACLIGIFVAVVFLDTVSFPVRIALLTVIFVFGLMILGLDVMRTDDNG